MTEVDDAIVQSMQAREEAPPNDSNNAEEDNANANDNEDDNDNDNDDGPSKNLMADLHYCFASFHAIFTPVSITMILSALAVVNINTEETRAEGEAAFSSTYEVFDLEEGNSSQNVAASLANVMIIVSVICFMTFVIVILYKYGCTKFFLGYMVTVTAMLLGYFTSNMAIVAIQKYDWHIDKLSFAYVIWNYAIVGVLAIFYNTGIPKVVTQGYLVTSSVVLAWQLSYFNDWTAWTLLVMLAVYDLFAVLSPCGPLKALTKLMSRPGAQPLPGLLYEASLPDGVSRPNRRNDPQQQQTEQPESSSEEQQRINPGSQSRSASNTSREESPEARMHQSSSLFVNERLPDHETQGNGSSSMFRQEETTASSKFSHHDKGSSFLGRSVNPSQFSTPNTDSNASETSLPTPGSPIVSREESIELPVSTSNRSEQQTGQIALAIAKMYKLQVIDEEGILSRPSRISLLRRRNELPSDYQREYTWEEIRAMEWTPQQLRTDVTVIFPERGGRIAKADDQSGSFEQEGAKYLVHSRKNELLRTFVVNREGKVLQVIKRERTEGADSPANNSIKLGLGDFIFYSVLVSKAALHSFTAFAACMVTILFGLGATLVLLAVHGKALPALPISIFLAVSTFLMTQYFAEPFIQEILRQPYYV